MNTSTVNHTKSNQNGPINNRLPLIPLSPLTQTSIEYAKALAQTTKSLSETTVVGTNGSSNNNIISLLNKDLSKERENLDRLTKDIQSIQSKFLSDLNNYEVAKEIAYINCSLFRLVVLNKTWISNFDKQSNIVPLLDFHRYLSHSFSHQIIYSAAEEEGSTTESKRRKSIHSNTNNTIAQLIQIAYILLHIYRDFSGCTAILTSLQMPEVQRLEKLWSQCSTKLVSTYKDMVCILSPKNNYEAYHHHLWLHTARFLNTAPLKSQMVAVPFMHAHLTLIRNLIHTHSAVMNSNKQNIILSDAGKKSFISAIHVLEFCQQHAKIDPSELDRPISIAASRRLSTSSSKKRSSTYTNGFKLSASPCLELDKLHTSPNLYHWIVSRAYLNRSQLHQESLQVEPLAIGEIELETEEEYDLYWDFFSQPASVVEDATQQESSSSAIKDAVKISKELTAQEDPQQKGEEEEVSKKQKPIDHQIIVDDLIIVTPDKSSNDEDINEAVKVSDILSSAAPDIANEEDNTESSRVSNISVPIVKDGQSDVNTQADLFIEEEMQQKEEEDNKADNLIIDDIENANEKVKDSTVEKVDLLNNSTETIKPMLSPAALEFVPQQHQYDDSVDDDDIIIVTEEMSYKAEENEEEEEWTGYPLDNIGVSQIEEETTLEYNKDDDDEEEEWTGYPIASQDEDEDDDEVWKGYPAPRQQQFQQSSPKTVDLSSPSTPQEDQHEDQQSHATSNPFSNNKEWKGYERTSEEEQEYNKNNTSSKDLMVNKSYPISWDDNKNQLQAIGKAAARKMQYSISNTDNRKRLPTMFTPSAST